MHPLDRPVWESLRTAHAARAIGGPLARRFAPDVNVFGSARDDSPQALAALAALVAAGPPLFVLQVPPVVVPPGLVATTTARGVQMVATRPLAGEVDLDGVEVLGDDDAEEMRALARSTRPGPFVARTHTMGRFVGIRDGGRLVAMAGERLRQPGHTEISGVCTHPDARGRGLARRLSAAVAAGVQARGEVAYLHAWSTNEVAIGLYRSLGFELRTEVEVAVLERAPDAPGQAQ